jgi:hypothetical protein
VIERLCARELSCFLTTPEDRKACWLQDGKQAREVSLDRSQPAGPSWRWRCWHHRRPDHRRLCSCWRARVKLFCLPARESQFVCEKPRLRAACNWSAQRFLAECAHRDPRYATSWTTRQKDDDGGGRHGRSRQNGHDGHTPMASPAAALTVDPGTANLVQ